MAKRKVIKIKCEGTQYVDFHELNEFQEDIKQSSREDLDKLKEEIKKAFRLPFCLWKNKEKWWILDGHQRKKALTELEKEGWCVPLLPAVEIKADTEAEAKKNVLLFISQTGEVDKDKLKIYVEKHKIELKNIVIRTKPINLNNDIKKTIHEEEVKPYKRMHILLSFHPDILIQVKVLLEKIKAIEGVEYEQGEN
jgi:hypothetical protein